MADFRLPASPDRTRELLDLLSRAMDGVLVPEDGRLTTAEREFIAAVSRDLREHGPDSLCVAGTEQDPDVQAWALAMNARIGAIGRTVTSFRRSGPMRTAAARDDWTA